MVVKETPNLINRILSLLDTMKSPENQKLVLRVISALGESTENKLEIGIVIPFVFMTFPRSTRRFQKNIEAAAF